MAWRFTCKKAIAEQLALLATVIAVLLATLAPVPTLLAAELSQRGIRVSDAQAAQNGVTYRVEFSTLANSLIGSIRVQFCSDSPLVDDPCAVPNGFDIDGATFTSQTGITGFSISANTTANEMVLSRPPLLETPTTATYVFSGVTNPFNGGSMYARIYTYATSDGTGPYTDSGGMALYFQGALGVMAEVPPYLWFCLGESITGFDCDTATEPFSDIGVLSPLTTGLAQSQMVTATNATGGYTMWVLGGTMTSGNNTIPALAGAASQAGVSQFGINLRANTAPLIGQDPAGPGAGALAAGYNTPNQFRFQSGDAVASVTAPDDFRKYTASYIVNVDSNQPGGVYATTLTYVVLANF